MKTSTLTLVDGTSALAPSAQLEAELLKDRWDARNIPGLRYAPHTGNYYINFTKVPEVFRPIVKDYAKFLLAAGRVALTLGHCVYYLGKFFTFFSQRYPGVCTLQNLVEQDIDAFLLDLRATPNSRGKKTSDRQIWISVHHVEELLLYLERIESPMKSSCPTARIIWPHHYPSDAWKKSQGIKYISQGVLSQLDGLIQHLAPSCIPIVILLRASGWRISDVLYLKLDTCLEQEGNEKYWLVGDIQKTRVLGHKIPITQEIAAVIKTQITWVKQHYMSEENPRGWLFPASKTYGHGKSNRFKNGDPLGAQGVNQTLNYIAVKYQIKDEQGRLFHFKSHAFRHTKAVELLNNGMSLVLVQQWMAHASPEMTLIYAKILDETMHKAWEKAVHQGIVQFTDGKPEFVPGKKLLPMAGANAFDPERVREHRQNVKMALGSCLKTAKIVCKFVELPCFHCPAYVLTPDDLPALEAYAQQILERIEIGKQAGNIHWIEVNQKNLDERVLPAIAMLKEGQIVAKSEKYEREYTPAEWTRLQAEQRKEETDE
jgi:integrase